MKSLWQDVEQETTDELVSAERQCAVPRLPVTAVILVPKGHAALVESNKPAVRDGDAHTWLHVLSRSTGKTSFGKCPFKLIAANLRPVRDVTGMAGATAKKP